MEEERKKIERQPRESGNGAMRYTFGTIFFATWRGSTRPPEARQKSVVPVDNKKKEKKTNVNISKYSLTVLNLIIQKSYLQGVSLVFKKVLSYHFKYISLKLFSSNTYQPFAPLAFDPKYKSVSLLNHATALFFASNYSYHVISTHAKGFHLTLQNWNSKQCSAIWLPRSSYTHSPRVLHVLLVSRHALGAFHTPASFTSRFVPPGFRSSLRAHVSSPQLTGTFPFSCHIFWGDEKVPIKFDWFLLALLHSPFLSLSLHVSQGFQNPFSSSSFSRPSHSFPNSLSLLPPPILQVTTPQNRLSQNNKPRFRFPQITDVNVRVMRTYVTS